jgi:hypothetical protein
MIVVSGQEFLLAHKNSIYRLLTAACPDLDVVAWKFEQGVPTGYWSDPITRRRFFDWLFQELQLQSLDQWYSVPREVVINNGGIGLITHYYSNSLVNALKALYPEHNWLEWRFPKVSRSYWTEESRRTAYLMWLKEYMGYTRPEDWYQLKREDLKKTGGAYRM